MSVWDLAYNLFFGLAIVTIAIFAAWVYASMVEMALVVFMDTVVEFVTGIIK